MAEHSCSYVEELKSSSCFQIKLNYENDGWFFCHISIASDIDVKSGEAETVGEEMSRLNVKINYCPFCGELL